jgi:endonuclease YncB( thermonuclease family)
VNRVIDGDTFDSPAGRVRLFGVDTPERGEDCYGDAARRLRELAGEQVRVQSGPRQRDPNGRLLYYVYTDWGESIDELLVREGWAVAWTRDGQHRNLLGGLEVAARDAGRGCLW